jgi:glycyl-tRNA synthetase beta subunit
METTQIVVLSVLITLWTVGLLLTTIGLRKVQVKTAQNTADISAIKQKDEKEFEAIHRRVHELENDLRSNINQNLDEIHRRIDSILTESEKREESIHRRIDEAHIVADSKHDSLSRMVEELHREEERSLDRRFDRIYQMLYDAFPQLRERA